MTKIARIRIPWGLLGANQQPEPDSGLNRFKRASHWFGVIKAIALWFRGFSRGKPRKKSLNIMNKLIFVLAFGKSIPRIKLESAVDSVDLSSQDI